MSVKAPKILDNKSDFVYRELEESIKKGSKLSVISAYFSMYAYDSLKKDLNKINNMCFIYTKPTFLKNDNKESRQYYIDNNSIFGNDYEIKLKNEMTQGSVSKECSQWIRDKVEIKSFKSPNEAQPRMICVNNGDDSDIAINGSVDFTTAGLGLNNSTRQDVNNCVYGQMFTQSSLMMFDSLWNNDDLLEDVKDEVLNQMQTMYKENPAEFIYFLSLYNIFSGNLDELEGGSIREGNNLKNTKIWNKLYNFQKDAVVGAIEKIENHNGCILADSVGLGKTFTALAIIKYYESRNDRVLVLVPKKLRDNWTIYTQNDKRNIFADDRFNYDVLNHTDLSRQWGKSGDIDLKTINWGNYDLVVIDESHNFRNNPAVKDRKTRYQKLMNEIIKGGHKTRLLMLSATPVNNKMNDIKNQIAFITEDNDQALVDVGINSISFTLRNAQGVFNKWAKMSELEKTDYSFIDMIDLDYFQLLDTLTIARSRKHIEKYYDLDEIGEFPERLPPINIKSEIDLKNEFPTLYEVNNEISKLELAIYSPMRYILPNKMSEYEKKYDMEVGHGSTFKQLDRDVNVTHLMRINLLKRMESSIHSFKLTTERILDMINQTLDKLDDGTDYNPSISISSIDLDGDDEYIDNLMIGNKRKVLLQDMDLIKWRQDLELDKERLEHLFCEAEKVSPEMDAKLNDLKLKIKDKISNPINPQNKKLIVFTAFADTAKYLYKNIDKWALDEFDVHSALVTGGGDNKTTLKGVVASDINDILTNFSPISKERLNIDPDATNEIDILICTDCISEGQNLQDCDYLINYDIHWNPVRIIQRFGRIDRIGSLNKQIQLVNFWPNMELDEYINLEGRVKKRMVMVDVAASGEENIISNNQKMNDLDYRRKQLEELQDKVLDLEDISNSISITDLTFNDFKTELMNYIDENKLELDKAPKGIYSIVDIPHELKNELESGVIFLLKQIKGTTESSEKNPLSPYYLVYIGEDGEVKYSYIKSKHVLDYYKKLCLGKTEVLKDLVADFDEDTNNGKDMSKYSELLVETIEDILGKKQEVGVKSLFGKGGTATLKKDIDGLEEFELINFLIVK